MGFWVKFVESGVPPRDTVVSWSGGLRPCAMNPLTRRASFSVPVHKIWGKAKYSTSPRCCASILPCDNSRRTRPGTSSHRMRASTTKRHTRQASEYRLETMLPFGTLHRLGASPLDGVLVGRAANFVDGARKKRQEVGKPRTRRQWLVSSL